MASIVAEPSNPTYHTPPRKPRHKATRVKEESKLLRENIGDIIVTPKPKKQDYQRSQPKDVSKLHNDGTSPLTPPSYPVPIDEVKTEQGGSPAPTTRKNKRGRKKTLTKQEVNGVLVGNSIMKAPVEHSIRSPPANPAQPVATPLKQGSQMYAGPTFHASPAPSSLPIPKFFTKPSSQTEIPDNTKLTSSDESSSQDESSQGCGDSPTLRNSLRVAENKAREPSPLDIFFKADREEKARKAQDSPNGASLISIRAKSASPSADTFRQHSRRPTDTSLTPTSPNSADEMKAKSEALKNLLLFPQAHRSSSAVNANTSSPSLASPHRPSLDRTPSDSPTPTRTLFYANHPHATRSQGSIHDSPTFPAPRMGHLPSQQRRPLPHHLRQELLNSLPLGSTDDEQFKPRYVSSLMP